MLVAPSGIVIDAREEQLEKAPAPMLVTLLGIEIDVSLRQAENAL